MSGLMMEAETVFGKMKGQWFYFQLLTEIGVEPFKLQFLDSTIVCHTSSVKQSASQSQNIGLRLTHFTAGGPPSQGEGFAHGAALPDDFKLWLSRHPGLTIDEAISRYREEQKAKRRRQGPKLL